MIRLIIGLSAILFLFCTCGREEVEVFDADFSGTWRNRDTVRSAEGILLTYYMHIEGDNSILELGKDPNGICFIKTEGNVLINRKHKKLIATQKNKFSVFRARLDINELPFQNANGQWQCTVENIVMIRD